MLQFVTYYTQDDIHNLSYTVVGETLTGQTLTGFGIFLEIF